MYKIKSFMEKLPYPNTQSSVKICVKLKYSIFYCVYLHFLTKLMFQSRIKPFFLLFFVFIFKIYAEKHFFSLLNHICSVDIMFFFFSRKISLKREKFFFGYFLFDFFLFLFSTFIKSIYLFFTSFFFNILIHIFC